MNTHKTEKKIVEHSINYLKMKREIKINWNEKKRINYSGCHKTIILTPFEIKTKKKKEKKIRNRGVR